MLPFPNNEPLFVGANVERLKNEVHSELKYDINTGIEATILWWETFFKNSN